MYNPYSIGTATNNSYSYNYIKSNNIVYNVPTYNVNNTKDINPIINLNIKRNENI